MIQTKHRKMPKSARFQLVGDSHAESSKIVVALPSLLSFVDGQKKQELSWDVEDIFIYAEFEGEQLNLK